VLALNVSGFVQAPLAVVGPNQVRFNNGVEVGKKEERNVPIQAEVPFKITAVEGQGDGVSVAVLPVQPKKAQVVTVVFAPEKPGPVKKTLTVQTNIGKSVTIEVEGTGKDPQ
jgi:Abnormal spindle-like microcephaly-assoc'd, ASPM-SPD-2-Hydin